MNPPFDPDRVEAICFDIDGTLADTDDAYVQRLARALYPLGFLISEETRQNLARRWVMAAETPVNAITTLLDRLLLNQPLGAVQNTLHRLRGEKEPHQLIPGVRTMLETLAEQYPLTIVTARQQRSAEYFLRATNLRPLFRCVATARTCSRAKPHPAPVRWAAEQIEIPPDACVMVGDTTVDIRAGVAAGAQTVGVLCGFGQRHELERSGANLILESTPELTEVLLWGK
ncbi:MAG: HAD family hydrolase [Anaerolineaceae bacterium]|nr:MAG: HAD family hydrolase [Anaerolineaceae bacterium]